MFFYRSRDALTKPVRVMALLAIASLGYFQPIARLEANTTTTPKAAIQPEVSPTEKTALTSIPLRCQIDGSDDIFIFYPDMKISETRNYIIYQQLGGLIVAIVDTKSLRFNRLTSLNLTASPYPATFITGQCKPQQQHY